jgi:hypothetical protein
VFLQEFLSVARVRVCVSHTFEEIIRTLYSAFALVGNEINLPLGAAIFPTGYRRDYREVSTFGDCVAAFGHGVCTHGSETVGWPLSY